MSSELYRRFLLWCGLNCKDPLTEADFEAVANNHEFIRTLHPVLQVAKVCGQQWLDEAIVAGHADTLLPLTLRDAALYSFFSNRICGCEELGDTFADGQAVTTRHREVAQCRWCVLLDVVRRNVRESAPPFHKPSSLRAWLDPAAYCGASLSDYPAGPRGESPVEAAFWGAYLRSEGATQHALRGLVREHAVLNYRLDFALPGIRVGIEIDGHAYHSDAETFHNDRVRQRKIESEGWRLIRFSGREVHRDANTAVIEAGKLIVQWHPDRRGGVS